jgi:hypothetical protein
MGAVDRPKKRSGRHAVRLRRDGITAPSFQQFQFLDHTGSEIDRYRREEDGFRRFLVAALTGVGYSVVDPSNSNHVIMLLNGDVPFDLLIADVKMLSRQPHGIAVGNIARLKRSHIKIIYVSGNPSYVPSGLIDITETPLLGKPIRLITPSRRRSWRPGRHRHAAFLYSIFLESRFSPPLDFTL